MGRSWGLSWRLLGLGLLIPGLASCGTEGEYLPGLSGGNAEDTPEGACAPGKTRDCGITLERANGLLTCAEGTQECNDDGSWQECLGGKITRRADPFSVEHGKFFKTFALSTPSECGSINPCDPGCHIFEEPGPFATPVDSGSPADWTEGPPPTWSAPSCAVSDLCSVHASPLDSTCDPCVQQICSNSATDHCCTDGSSPTSWDQDCVNAVYTICGMVDPPGPPNGGFCDWGALADGPIRFGNGGLSGTAIGSTGDPTGSPTPKILLETSATNCSYRTIVSEIDVDLRNDCDVNGDIVSLGDVWLEAPGGSTTQVTGTVHASGNVDLRNGAQVDNGVTAQGKLELAASPQTRVTGDVHVGSIVMGSNSVIDGNARSVGNITGNLGATITGSATVNGGSSVSSNVSVGSGPFTGTVVAPADPVPQLPQVSNLTRDLSAECTAAAAKGPSTYMTGTHTLTPGIYGALIFEGSSTELILEPGNYVFQSIMLRSDADMSFSAPTGQESTSKWDITTCGQFIAEDSYALTVNGSAIQPTPDNFFIYSAGAPPYGVSYRDGAIFFGSNNDFNATMIAPNGKINLGNNVTVDGFMWSKEIYTDTSTNFNQGGLPSCEGSNIWGATCDGYVLYDDSATSYVAGSEAHSGGLVYRCTDATKCNSGAGYDGSAGYWPGRGADWAEAWQQITACTTPVLPDPDGTPSTPTACPVTVTPGADLWSTPCQSGRDCQVDHRCVNVRTNGTCNHSKCEEGSFIPLGCDPCVDLICDPDGDGSTSHPCCVNATGPGEWDADCVALVESTCDATCGLTVGCEHDLCDVGGGIAQNTSCHPCAAEICAARPSCCLEDGDGSTDEWDSTCVDLVHAACGTEGTSICDFAIFGESNVETGDGCRVVGGSVGGDADGLYLDYGCTVQDVFADSSVVLYDTTAGDVFSADQITEIGSSTTQASVESAALTLPAVPTKTFSCGTDPADDEDFGSADGTHALAPGTYRLVALTDDGSGADNAIELSAGTYNIASLDLGSDTKLILPLSGDVVLNVCDSLTVGSGVVFEGSGGSLGASDALRLQVHVSGTTPITVGQGSVVYGVWSAPNTSISLSVPGAFAATIFYGMAWAKEVELLDLAQIDASGLTGPACHAAGLGEPPAASCPVTTTTGTVLDESGQCVDNLGEKDTCSGIDLSLGAPCEESIPVCNRGDTTFSGSVDLTFWPESEKQMGTELPDLSGLVGTCTFSGNIEPGECVTHDCSGAGFLNQTMTVMVNAPDSTGSYAVTECSVLDNWTVFVDGQVCSEVCLDPPCEPTSEQLVIVEDYTAVCPDQMAPLWSVLGWDATLAGDADIVFEAATDPGMSAAFVPLAQASVAGASCPISAPCSVDLTASLSLGTTNHPETIYLRITLVPDDLNLATLNDWDVTYSCQYDQ